jgi:hypothetical protein
MSYSIFVDSSISRIGTIRDLIVTLDLISGRDRLKSEFFIYLYGSFTFDVQRPETQLGLI